jgi:hypothetical protein
MHRGVMDESQTENANYVFNVRSHILKVQDFIFSSPTTCQHKVVGSEVKII